MLHRFVDTIRNFQPTSGFELYVINLQRSRLSTLPTVEEARRDFQHIFTPEAYRGL